MRDALPNATYLGFTGTPVESTDNNTPAVFGNYVDIYDIAQAVEDGATVPIYYESRLVKINLSDEGRQLIEELDKELAVETYDNTSQQAVITSYSIHYTKLYDRSVAAFWEAKRRTGRPAPPRSSG